MPTKKTKRWTNGQLVEVSLAIQNDTGFAANVINCPVCGKKTLNYDSATAIDCAAWCETCKTGLQQGGGLAATI